MLCKKSVKLVFMLVFIAPLIGILCLPFFSSPVFASKAGMEIVFSFDKNEYTVNEPILADIKLVNKSRKNIWVNKRFYLGTEQMPAQERDWYFIVTSPSGDKLESIYSFAAGFPKSDFFQALAPGEQAAPERPRNIRGFYDFKEPGTYKLQAVYENVYGSEIGLDAFKDKIFSEKVEIKILGS